MKIAIQIVSLFFAISNFAFFAPGKNDTDKQIRLKPMYFAAAVVFTVLPIWIQLIWK